MAWIKVGTAVIGAAVQYKGQRDATKAQQQGINQAQSTQQAALAQSRQDFQPYSELGVAGANGLQRLLADPNSIQNSAAYQWTRGQGLQGLDRSAAARGGLWSGGADADRMAYASGLASQEYGNEWNRLSGLANSGQQVAGALGNLGQGFAANMGNLQVGAADARASGYANQSNTLGQLAGVAGNAFGDWWSNRQAQRAPSANANLGTLAGFGNNPGWGV